LVGAQAVTINENCTSTCSGDAIPKSSSWLRKREAWFPDQFAGELCVRNLPVNKGPCCAGKRASFDSASVVLLAHAAFLTEGQAHDHPLARLADAKNTQDEN
jgi:hypothetical protein